METEGSTSLYVHPPPEIAEMFSHMDDGLPDDTDLEQEVDDGLETLVWSPNVVRNIEEAAKETEWQTDANEILDNLEHHATKVTEILQHAAGLRESFPYILSHLQAYQTEVCLTIGTIKDVLKSETPYHEQHRIVIERLEPQQQAIWNARQCIDDYITQINQQGFGKPSIPEDVDMITTTLQALRDLVQSLFWDFIIAFGPLDRHNRGFPCSFLDLLHREIILHINWAKAPARMFVNAQMPYVMHGYDTPDGDPHTLVIFTFHMSVGELGKRFRAVHITATFETGVEPTTFPMVVGMSPRHTKQFWWSKHLVTKTKKIGVSSNLTMGTGDASGVDVRPNISNIRTEETVQWNCARLAGDVLAEKGSPHPNGVYWDLLENTSTKSGVPSFLQTAVLLKRRREDVSKRFYGVIAIDANVSGAGLKSSWRKIWWRLQDPGSKVWVHFKSSSPDRPGPYLEYRTEMARLPDLDTMSKLMLDGPSTETHEEHVTVAARR
jgi:hypothetical protein